MNKRDKQLKSIKKKLMAATAMLLVASTMMVSSTYAWFTLSTAPEVTGISTTVGANGSLEIALSGPGGQVSDIGDPNMTWGNLVDMAADPNKVSYGLNKITLYPSALNEVLGVVNPSAPLRTPTYGADGRVAAVDGVTSTANYDTEGAKWAVGTATQYGVRAIGAVSGQTEQAIALQSARSQLNIAAGQARTKASNTLNANGGAIGNIAVAKASGGDGAIAKANVVALKALIDGLQETTDIIASAMKYGILGWTASEDFNDNGTAFYTEVSKMYETATLEDVILTAFGTATTTEDVTTITKTTEDKLPTDNFIVKAYTRYNEAVDALAEAEELYNTATATDKEKYTWDEISAVFGAMATIDKITVNDWTVTQIQADMSGFASKVIKDGGKLVVTVPSGSGVLSDIADLAGDYSAVVTMTNVSVGGFEFDEATATMEAKGISPAHLPNIKSVLETKSAISEGGAEGGTEGSDKTFSDTYGYIIDFLFRTNAADSKLLLQTQATGRVYGDETVEGDATMGGGSTMTFVVDENFLNRTNAAELMNNIKLVFMDQTGYVLAKGGIDFAAVNFEAEEVAEGQKGEVTIDAPIYLMGAAGKIEGESAIITALTQNEAKMVSVLVYLDGANVDNTMVANAVESMKGTLNLQFASSAELIPMQNSQLKELKAEENEGTEEDETPAATEYEVTSASSNEGTIVIGTYADGSVTAKNKFAAGEDVYVSVTAEGKTVQSVVADGSINATLVEGTTSVYTFKMPERAANVVVTYAA